MESAVVATPENIRAADNAVSFLLEATIEQTDAGVYAENQLAHALGFPCVRSTLGRRIQRFQNPKHQTSV